jgi:RNA polymerase sigma-70 factor (ECF subfamily)
VIVSDTLSPDEERDLIAQAADPAAFRRLYRHYVPRVFAYVAYRVGTKQDAEDIVADVFVKVLKSISTFEYRGEGSFAAWLFRIAYHEVVQHYRRQGRRQTPIPLDDVPDLHSPQPSPDAHLLQKERFLRLQAMLHTLSPRRQEIISLRFFGGLQNKEIADVLSLSEKTVASHLCRGLDDLQTKYRQEEFTHE